MAYDFFVRPAGTVNNPAIYDGTTYESAWAGWNNVLWSGAAGVEVNAGDTLYVCGYHDTSSGMNQIGVDGTLTDRVTIRGDYAGDAGSVLGPNSWSFTRDYVTVKNITWNAGNFSLFYMSGVVTGATLENITSTNLRRLLFFATASGNVFTDITVKDCNVDGSGDVIFDSLVALQPGTTTNSIQLIRLVVQNNTVTGATGFAVNIYTGGNGAPNLKVSNPKFLDNIFYTCARAALRVQGDDYLISSVATGASTTLTFSTTHNYVIGSEVYVSQLINDTGPAMPDGIYTVTATPTSSSITIAFDTTGATYPSVGYARLGNVITPYFNDIEVSGNEFYDMGGSVSGGCMSIGEFTPSVPGNRYAKNYIKDNIVDGVNGNGGGMVLTYNQYMEISGNNIRNANNDGNTGGIDNGGIDMDHGNGNCIITRNYVYNCRRAPDGVDPDNSGYGMMQLTGVNNYFISNVIDSCNHGMQFGGTNGIKRDIFVYNNVIVNSLDTGVYDADIMTGDSCYVYNNVIVNGPCGIWRDQTVDVLWSGNNILYNNTTNYENPTGNMDTATDIIADPLLNSTYHPAVNSPAYHAGTFMGHYRDFNGRPYNIPPTIGAYEFTSGAPAQPRKERKTDTINAWYASEEGAGNNSGDSPANAWPATSLYNDTFWYKTEDSAGNPTLDLTLYLIGKINSRMYMRTNATQATNWTIRGDSTYGEGILAPDCTGASKDIIRISPTYGKTIIRDLVISCTNASNIGSELISYLGNLSDAQSPVELFNITTRVAKGETHSCSTIWKTDSTSLTPIQNIKIHDCTISDTYDHPIYLYSTENDLHNVRIYNNTFTNCCNDYTNEVIHIMEGYNNPTIRGKIYDIKVYNNDFIDCSNSGAGPSALYVQQNESAGSTIILPESERLERMLYDIHITDNTFIRTGGPGCAVKGIRDGDTIESCGSEYTLGNTISYIKNNTFIDCSRYGTQGSLENVLSRGLHIEGNTVINSHTLSATDGVGIWLDVDCKRNIVRHNFIKNAYDVVTLIGIVLQSGTTYRIEYAYHADPTIGDILMGSAGPLYIWGSDGTGIDTGITAPYTYTRVDSTHIDVDLGTNPAVLPTTAKLSQWETWPAKEKEDLYIDGWGDAGQSGIRILGIGKSDYNSIYGNVITGTMSGISIDTGKNIDEIPYTLDIPEYNRIFNNTILNWKRAAITYRSIGVTNNEIFNNAFIRNNGDFYDGMYTILDSNHWFETYGDGTGARYPEEIVPTPVKIVENCAFDVTIPVGVGTTTNGSAWPTDKFGSGNINSISEVIFSGDISSTVNKINDAIPEVGSTLLTSGKAVVAFDINGNSLSGKIGAVARLPG